MKAPVVAVELARSPRLARAGREHLGALRRAERLPGGNVSFVYRLWGDRTTLVLKIRRDRLARIPALATSPMLVADEARALRLFGGALPRTFPGLVAVDADRGLLLIEDLGPDCTPLGDLWARNGPSRSDAAALGEAVGRFHAATAHLDRPLSGDRDAQVRRHLTGYCLREFGHPALVAAADRCLAEPGLAVHGDLAPKNLLRTAAGIGICDVEAAHCGSREFEIAYVTAHLLLHGASGPDPSAAVDAFARSYLRWRPITADPRAGGHALVLTIGVLLYRLGNRHVGYALSRPLDRGAARAGLLAALDGGPLTLDRTAGILAGARPDAAVPR